jgi:ubiquinone biosynthesis protein COQ4
VLAFSFAQLKHPGVGFLAGLGWVLSPEEKYRRFIVDGFRRGRRAAWLPAQDWEALLPLPLDEVRRRLGVAPVGPYETVRTGAAQTA